LRAPSTWSGLALQQPDGPDFTYFEQKTFVGLIDHRDPGNVLKYWADSDSNTEHAFNLSTDPTEHIDVLQHTLPALRQEWRLRALTGVELR
jgi:hypothetical protein